MMFILFYDNGPFVNSTAAPTPGPTFEFGSPQAGNWTACSDDAPCGKGQGDCDSDTECTAGHFCAQDVGANYGGHQMMDVCEEIECHPAHMDWNCCGPNARCEVGRGDCDTDADCYSGYCREDAGAIYGVTATFDVCDERPSLAPTAKPTDVPTVARPIASSETEVISPLKKASWVLVFCCLAGNCCCCVAFVAFWRRKREEEKKAECATSLQTSSGFDKLKAKKTPGFVNNESGLVTPALSNFVSSNNATKSLAEPKNWIDTISQVSQILSGKKGAEGGACDGETDGNIEIEVHEETSPVASGAEEDPDLTNAPFATGGATDAVVLGLSDY